MPSSSPVKIKGRHLDPLTPSGARSSGQNTRRGLATSPRGQSSPTKGQQGKQPLHIRMNLTETQMDKITDA